MEEVWNAFICLCNHVQAHFLKFLYTWWKSLNFIYHQTWNFRGCSNPAQRQCTPVETTFPLSPHRVESHLFLHHQQSCWLLKLPAWPGGSWAFFLPAGSGSPVAFASWKLPCQCSTSKPSGKESSSTTPPLLVSPLSWRCGTCALWEDLAFLNVKL